MPIHFGPWGAFQHKDPSDWVCGRNLSPKLEEFVTFFILLDLEFGAMREGRGNFKPHLNRVITPWKMRYMKNERQAVRRGSKSNPGARIPLLDSRKVVIKAPRATLQSFLPRILFWKEKLIETTLKFDNVVEVQTTLNLAHDRPIILGVHRLSPNETSYITKIILRHLRREISFSHLDR